MANFMNANSLSVIAIAVLLVTLSGSLCCHRNKPLERSCVVMPDGSVNRHGVVEPSIRLCLPRRIRSSDSPVQISPLESASHRMKLQGIHLRSVSSTQESSITGVETVDNDTSWHVENDNPSFRMTIRSAQQPRVPVYYSIDNEKNEKLGLDIFDFVRVKPFKRISHESRQTDNRKRRSIGRRKVLQKSANTIETNKKSSQSDRAHSSKQHSKQHVLNPIPILSNGNSQPSNVRKFSQSSSYPNLNTKRYSQPSWLTRSLINRGCCRRFSSQEDNKPKRMTKKASSMGRINEDDKKKADQSDWMKAVKTSSATENISKTTSMSEGGQPSEFESEKFSEGEEDVSVTADKTNSRTSNSVSKGQHYLKSSSTLTF